jgi:uncharacterized peroxidase-related enzyme
MARLNTIDPAQATGKAKELLAAVQAKLKLTPNMTRVMANSPAVLEAYLNFSSALAGGALGAKLGEQIALAVAQVDQCEYCLSAHSAIGKLVGLTDSDIAGSREGQGSSPRVAAALRFARQLVESRGIVGDDAIAAVRQAGFSDGEIAEIIAHVALNIFTNYFNNAAAVDIDFPKVALGKTA